MSGFSEAYQTAHVIETLENYAVADEVSAVHAEGRRDDSDYPIDVADDRSFWQEVLDDPARYWERCYIIHECAASSWVARVPGLYWQPQSSLLRDRASAEIELESDEWLSYSPPGKSMQVHGGIGTLRFPPDDNGRHLLTLTCGVNASGGIPVLAGDDVWQKLGGAAAVDGRSIVHAEGIWRQMETQWAQRFIGVRGFPRGYMIVASADDIEVQDSAMPVQFHPFSIMEYEKGDSRLFDFVYATADSRVPDWRTKVSEFFDDYRSREKRFGRYLTSADIADPLWDADYLSPADLRRSDAGNRSHLELLTARVQDRMRGDDLIETTLRALGRVCSSHNELGVLSDDLAVPRGSWQTGGSLADNAAAFVAVVKDRPGKLEELVDLLATRYPEINGD